MKAALDILELTNIIINLRFGDSTNFLVFPTPTKFGFPDLCQEKVVGLQSELSNWVEFLRGTKRQFRQVEPEGGSRRRMPISLRVGFQPGRVIDDAAAAVRVTRQKQQ